MNSQKKKKKKKIHGAKILHVHEWDVSAHLLHILKYPLKLLRRIKSGKVLRQWWPEGVRLGPWTQHGSSGGQPTTPAYMPTFRRRGRGEEEQNPLRPLHVALAPVPALKDTVFWPEKDDYCYFTVITFTIMSGDGQGCFRRRSYAYFVFPCWMSWTFWIFKKPTWGSYRVPPPPPFFSLSSVKLVWLFFSFTSENNWVRATTRADIVEQLEEKCAVSELLSKWR